MLRDLIESLKDAVRSMYWNVMEILSALNPLPVLGSFFRELWDLLYTLREGLQSAFGGLLALPAQLFGWLYQALRFVVLLPLEIAALFGIGHSRFGWRDRLGSPIAAVGETIGGISESVSELQPTRIGARLTEETRDAGYAVASGTRRFLGTLAWAPVGFMYFLYDLLVGITTVPGRIKSAIVNRTKKQLAIAACFAAFSGACLFGVYSLWKTGRARSNKIASLWHEFDASLRMVNTEQALAALEKLEVMLPTDTTVRKRLDQLRSGKPAADDLSVLRMYMRLNLAEKKLDKAAEHARTMVAAQPNDWEGNIILAHHALEAKDLKAANAFVQNMPDPQRVHEGIGPGGIVYAAKILRELKATDQLDKTIDFFIYRLLPVVNSYDVEKWPAVHKLQMVEGYLLSLEHLDRRPGLAAYWVPVQRLCRWALEEGKLDAESMARLGMLEEAQFNALEAFKTRKIIEAAEYDSNVREIETRLKVIWNEVLKRDPKNVRAYTAQSLARYRANDLPGAIDVLTKGIEVCGPKVELVAAKSQLLRAADPSKGFEFAKASAQGDPQSLQLLAILAETAVKNGRLDEALDACKKAIAAQPELFWANRLSGQICLEMRRPTEAVVAYRRIPKAVSDDPQTAAEYVRALCMLGMFEEVEKFVGSLSSNSSDTGQPDRSDVVAQCCNAMIRMNRSEMALKHVRALLEKRPGHVAGRLIHADLLRIKAEKGDEWDVELARQAIDEYRTILLRDPKNLAVVNNVAWLETKALKQPEQALRTVQPLCAIEQSHEISPDMLETLGVVYLANDQLEKAKSALARAVARGAPRASYFIYLAQVYLQLKQMPQAELYFSRARQFPMSPMEQREFKELAFRFRGNQ